jgi:hypothetical protein
MSAPKLIKVRREQLEPHPLTSALPTTSAVIRELESRPSKDESQSKMDFLKDQASAFKADFAETGIVEPLDVCPHPEEKGKFYVLDGRHRVEFSDADEFQARLHAVTSAKEVILSKVLQRRSVKQGARAWFLICMFPELADTESRLGGTPYETEGVSLTAASKRYGIRIGDLCEAAKTYRAAKEANLIDWASCSVMAATPLANIRRGLASKTSLKETKNKRRPVNYATLLDTASTSFCEAFKKWDKLDSEERKAAKVSWLKARKRLPDEIRKAEEATQ